ncbi:MAG: guanylate kinase [Candidatus Azotimanducaceae bacterium]
MNKGLLILISAPSGAGKTSLVNEIIDRDDQLIKSVSHTTRAKRPGEEESIDYFFTTEKEFNQMVSNSDFLEHAEVFGNFYGTSKNYVEENLEFGLDVILEIDWQGAQQIQSVKPDAISIFIVPPTKQELEKRLRNRGKDSEETISNRLSQATSDIKKAHNYNYVVVNDSFEIATNQLLTIVRAERLKANHQIKNNKTLAFLLSPK